ncbi:hypothetical protein O6H91_Y476900 [Diphasiastrum complanatum]|nr:hypothetical protein O6H91_Y476900 [Diphasiastrum complanatum]
MNHKSSSTKYCEELYCAPCMYDFPVWRFKNCTRSMLHDYDRPLIDVCHIVLWLWQEYEACSSRSWPARLHVFQNPARWIPSGILGPSATGRLCHEYVRAFNSISYMKG